MNFFLMLFGMYVLLVCFCIVPNKGVETSRLKKMNEDTNKD